jgi:hypothetical protein
MNIEEIDTTNCPHCGRKTVFEGWQPAPGFICLCFGCGRFAVLSKDLKLRKPSSAEQLVIDAEPALIELQIEWAGQVKSHTRGGSKSPR